MNEYVNDILTFFNPCPVSLYKLWSQSLIYFLLLSFRSIEEYAKLYVIYTVRVRRMKIKEIRVRKCALSFVGNVIIQQVNRF